ncbi:MAG: general secretion pathway protein GspK [Sedimentisphaerales bacterium]|nr:general secretion pathway protein GspK [Sedimentisphaerales bacterium]
MRSTRTTNRSKPAAARGRRGFVLLTVLLVVVLLTGILLHFNHAARSGLSASKHFVQAQQALDCAQAGLQTALATIARRPNLQTNKLLGDLLAGPLELTLPEGKCYVWLEDEAGKLNINTLITGGGEEQRRPQDLFLRLLDRFNGQFDRPIVPYAVLPALIDWLDRDDQPTVLPFLEGANRGAESAYYQSLQPAYACRNGPMPLLAELQSIKDMPAGALTRRDPYRDDPPDRIGLGECLTVYGADKINLNTAGRLVLESLSEHMNPQAVQAIMQQRRLRPFTNLEQVRRLPGMSPRIFNDIGRHAEIALESRFFTVMARGSAGPSRSVVQAVVDRDPERGRVVILAYRTW